MYQNRQQGPERQWRLFNRRQFQPVEPEVVSATVGIDSLDLQFVFAGVNVQHT